MRGRVTANTLADKGIRSGWEGGRILHKGAPRATGNPGGSPVAGAGSCSAILLAKDNH